MGMDINTTRIRKEMIVLMIMIMVTVMDTLIRRRNHTLMIMGTDINMTRIRKEMIVLMIMIIATDMDTLTRRKNHTLMIMGMDINTVKTNKKQRKQSMITIMMITPMISAILILMSMERTVMNVVQKSLLRKM